MGKSLDDAVTETRVRLDILKAIENGDLHLLPAPVYARGLVRIYLEYLGLTELMPQYEGYLGEAVKESSGAIPPVVKPPLSNGFRRRDNRWIVVLLGLAVLVAGYLVWQQKGSIGNAINRKAQQSVMEAEMQKTNSPPVLQGQRVSVDLVPGLAGSPASVDGVAGSDDLSWLPGHGTAPKATPAQEEKTILPLEITASGSCWLHVTRGGQMIFRGTLKKGETKVFPSDKDIQVRYGNPLAVAVKWQGKDLGNPSRQNKVVTILYKADGSFATR